MTQITAAAILVAVTVASVWTPSDYHALVDIETNSSVELRFVLQSQHNLYQCEAGVNAIVTATSTSCPNCRITKKACVSQLDAESSEILSFRKASLPTLMIPNGFIGYRGNQAEALAICEMAAEKMPTSSSRCYAPGVERELLGSQPNAGRMLFLGISSLISAAIMAWLVCYLIIKYEHVHAHLSHDHLNAGPQKFHAVPTPRIGGVAVIAGLFAAGAVIFLFGRELPLYEYGYLLIAAFPAFLGGVAEDVTKKVGVYERLLLTMLSAAIAALLLNSVVNRTDVPGVDNLLMIFPIALLFTIFAIGGVSNAINIIDGYNGLASGYAIIVLAAILLIGAYHNDVLVMTTSGAMIGSLIGFLKWNWPRGRIFLGDGGAYLVGFWVGELAVFTLYRHPEISPWFVFLLLIYPVFETLFTIYRRKLVRGSHPGMADAIHLHQLIYRRLVRIPTKNNGVRCVKRSDIKNSKVAPYFWVMVFGLCAVPAVYFWNNTSALIGFSALFCVAYLWMYVSILRWKVPGWMIITR